MYTKGDEALKPTSPPNCLVCKAAKRLVWVLKGKEIIAAIKCKCGTTAAN